MAPTILQTRDDVGNMYIGFVPHQPVSDMQARLRRYKGDNLDGVGYEHGVYFWVEEPQLACNWASDNKKSILIVTGADQEKVRSTAENASRILGLTEVHIPETELRRHIDRTYPRRN